jgi:Glycosyl transferases group 1/Glycosyltransferase Family 4
MKILIAQSMSYFDLGGAAKACRGLIEGLAQRGHSCAVVSIENREEMEALGFKGGAVQGVAELELDGVKIFAAETAQEQWRPMRECIRSFQPDWTLISEWGAVLLLTALQEQAPARVVLIAQTISTYTETESSLQEQIRSLVQQTGGLITVSNYMREYIRRWLGLDSTVLHFPSYGPGPFTCFNNFDTGYVTMINPCAVKGISIFLSLARSLSPMEFAAVPLWGTSPHYRAELEQLPNMTLLEPSPNLDDIFGQTKVLLVPSLWGEAYGQVVVDAMLRGIPVLASNVGGLPEAKLGVDYVLPVKMIERYELDSQNDVQPVVPEQDVKPWEEALSRVLTDRALYERVSLESREAALSYVSSVGAEPFERHFEALAAARKRAANA